MKRTSCWKDIEKGKLMLEYCRKELHMLGIEKQKSTISNFVG
jgi:hypothetical protein